MNFRLPFKPITLTVFLSAYILIIYDMAKTLDLSRFHYYDSIGDGMLEVIYISSIGMVLIGLIFIIEDPKIETMNIVMLLTSTIAIFFILHFWDFRGLTNQFPDIQFLFPIKSKYPQWNYYFFGIVILIVIQTYIWTDLTYSDSIYWYYSFVFLVSLPFVLILLVMFFWALLPIFSVYDIFPSFGEGSASAVYTGFLLLSIYLEIRFVSAYRNFKVQGLQINANLMKSYLKSSWKIMGLEALSITISSFSAVWSMGIIVVDHYPDEPYYISKSFIYLSYLLVIPYCLLVTRGYSRNRVFKPLFRIINE